MKWTIANKLLVGFLSVIVLLGIVSFVGLNGLSTANQQLHEIERIEENTFQASRLEASLTEEARAVFGHLMTREAIYKQDFEEARKRADEALAELQKSVRSSEGKAILARIEKAKTAYGTVARPLLDRKDFTEQEMKELTGKTMRGPRQEMGKAVEEFTKYQDTFSREVRAAAETSAGRTRTISLMVAAVAALLGISIAVVISQGVTRPIAAVNAQLKELAAGGGDLTRELQVRSKDEIGDLVKTFNSFVGTLRAMLRQVRESSQTVASSAEQLNSTTEQVAQAAQGVAQAVSQVAQGATSQSKTVQETTQVVEQLRSAITQIASGAQEQARSAQQTATVMGQMVTAIEDVAAKANNVSASSQQATDSAKSGSRVVEKTVDGMGRIRTSVLESAERIKKLGELSAQIGEITQVITDIADQTNLLALNAAIEAARAGEHGKGFAVVAEEVRKLAERAGKSAKEIADLIRSIQDGTAQAVKVMEQGTAGVEEGVKLAADAGRALQDILASVEQTMRDVEAITAASRQISASSREVAKSVDSVAAITEENTAATEEMAAGSDQVTKSVEEIASISEENAAAAEEVSASVEEMNASTEEIAASAQSLAKIAQELQSQVNRFQL